MSDIQLVLTDIDDTIAPHARHEVSDAVRQAITAVEEKGVKIVPVSGRPYELAEQTLNVLGISDLCVADGGATIVDIQSGKRLWKCWLDAARVRSILEILLPYAAELLYEEGLNFVDSQAITLDLVVNSSPAIFAFVDAENEETIKAALQDVPDIYSYFLNGTNPLTGAHKRAIQITHAEATKHHGVEALRSIVHVPVEQTLAIGDGTNDLPLFKSASIKVAMGNATEELKAAADFVVGTLEEDGFAEAMKKHVL